MRRLLLAIFPGMALFATVSTAQAANPDHLQQLLKTNQCVNCDLSNADLKDTNLFGANLMNANLRGAILKGANLGLANFTNADLSGANLEQAYLDRATLENANLTQADLTGAYLKNASTSGMQVRGTNLRRASLQNVDLVGVNLQGADLSEANLSGAMLSGFRVTNASGRAMLGFFSTPSALAGLMCQGYPLPNFTSEEFRSYGAEFMPANLVGANLKDANLSGAIVVRGNLTNANFAGANLKGTCLAEGVLRGAILDRADLQAAFLKGAILEGASLKETRNANLTETFQSDSDRQLQDVTKQMKSAVGVMMRTQQAYFLENAKFAATYQALKIDLAEPEQYVLRVFSQGDRTRLSLVAAVPKVNGLKTYIGLVNVSGKDQIPLAQLCVSQEAKPLLPKLPLNVVVNQPMPCPTGFQRVER